MKGLLQGFFSVSAPAFRRYSRHKTHEYQYLNRGQVGFCSFCNGLRFRDLDRVTPDSQSQTLAHREALQQLHKPTYIYTIYMFLLGFSSAGFCNRDFEETPLNLQKPLWDPKGTQNRIGIQS